MWSDSHDCAFHSQTIWASSPHNSQLPAWARVEEHSVFFPSCFKTRCLEHCRTLPWRGGEGGKALHRVTGEKPTAASLLLLKQRKKTLQSTGPSTAVKAEQHNGCFHTYWESMAQPACNHTFQGIEHFNSGSPQKTITRLPIKRTKLWENRRKKDLGLQINLIYYFSCSPIPPQSMPAPLAKKCISLPCS